MIAPGVDAITLFNVIIQFTLECHNPMQNHYSVQVILKVLNVHNNNTVTIYNDKDSDIYTRAKRHFVICNSCFWCASLYPDSRTIKSLYVTAIAI